jgi:hypothetical protein
MKEVDSGVHLTHSLDPTQSKSMFWVDGLDLVFLFFFSFFFLLLLLLIFLSLGWVVSSSS